MRFSEVQVKEWICRRLGKGVVGVELKDDQVDDAVIEAKQWWQMWVGQAKSVLITMPGGTEVPEASIATDIDSVVDVVFEISGNSFADYFSWADVELNVYSWLGQGGGGYSELVQYMQYREMAKSLVAADNDWDWDRARRVLTVTPEQAAGKKIMVTYLSTEMDMAYVTNYEMDVFRKYALAQAMKTLAMIRMKYSGKPSATGEFSMDGDALWANAEAIEAEVEEKMRNLQEPVGFWAE